MRPAGSLPDHKEAHRQRGPAMTETMSTRPTSAAADVTIRRLRESDLPEADHIVRTAFNTFLGVADVFGDKEYVRTRWLADPQLALAAELDGRLVGSNFVTGWGSVGFFGPLSVRPELWDQRIASRLMESTLDLIDRQGIRHAGLFTFPHSAKHHGLYQKFGFWPRCLTPVMIRPTSGAKNVGATCYTALGSVERAEAVDACRELTNAVYEGLDLTREIQALEQQGLGDVVLIDDASGLAGMAVCHIGTGSEGGGGGCYVKFGVVRSGAAADRFDALLDSCEALAAQRGATHVELGVNSARHEAYAAVAARGYRAVMVGVAMHRHNDEGYNRPGVWLIDDWR